MTEFRRSELLGVEWKDINLEDGTIIIQQSVSYANSQYYIKE